MAFATKMSSLAFRKPPKMKRKHGKTRISFRRSTAAGKTGTVRPVLSTERATASSERKCETNIPIGLRMPALPSDAEVTESPLRTPPIR